MNSIARSQRLESGLTRKWRLFMWACAAALLCAPLIAMQFTPEVNWTLGDFMIFGGMLLILIGGIEAAMKLPAGRQWRLAAAAAALLIFFIVWVELAVGIFP